MLKKISINLLLASLLFTACSYNKEYSGNEDLDSTNQLHNSNDTTKFEELTIESLDTIVKEYYSNNGELFTGEAVKYEMANDGMWSFIYSFKNGVMHRLDVYGTNGYQHRFVEMKNGYPYHTVMYHRNGKPYIEEYYDKEGNRVGTWKRWKESGELDWEKHLD